MFIGESDDGVVNLLNCAEFAVVFAEVVTDLRNVTILESFADELIRFVPGHFL